VLLVPWLGPPLMKYYRLCTSGLVNDGTCGAWLIGHILKVTHKGAEPGAECDVYSYLVETESTHVQA